MPERIQASAVATSGTSSVSATISTPTVGSLLIACGYSNQAAGSYSMSGWTLIAEGNTGSGSQSQCIFARVADGTEGTSVTLSRTSATVMRLQVLEYSGLYTGGTSPAAHATVTSTAKAAATSSELDSTGAAVDVFPACPTLLVAVVGFSGTVSAITFFATSSTYTHSEELVGAGDDRMGVGVAVVDFLTRFSATIHTVDNIGFSWTTSRQSGIVTALFDVDRQALASMGAG